MELHHQRIGKPHITGLTHEGIIVWRAMIRRSSSLEDADQFFAVQFNGKFPQAELSQCK